MKIMHGLGKMNKSDEKEMSINVDLMWQSK